MKDLQNYTTVLRDVGLESTPIREESGKYRWSNGQLKILNEDKYNKLSVNRLKMEHLDNSINDLSQEILAFEAPTEALEIEGNGVINGDNEEIEEQQAQLLQFKTSLDQLDKDLVLRGYIPPEENVASDDAVPPPKKVSSVTAKEIFGFLLIWLIGEVFMTYVQWNGLRDGRGIEDMIVRSISLGVVLFLIHLVGRFYKQESRHIHLVFLAFSFIMLFTMLLAPLLLNEAYPLMDEIDTSNQWSLQESISETSEEVVSPYPFWVNFYRKNDMLPGIFVFLFFVIMQTFVKQKPKVTPPLLPEITPEAGKNQIEERRQYFIQQIELIEHRLLELDQQQTKAVAPNTRRLQSILDELQTKQGELEELKKEKDAMQMDNELLIRKLEMDLSHYQTEYMNVLKNDPVKALVVQPVWPTNQDIKTYFNLS